MKTLAIIEDQLPELGLADAHGVCEHSLEHRFQLTGRTADDAEDLGGSGLLLQRFPQLVEQPGVLDGDDGLFGKARHQLNLLVREQANFLTKDNDSSN